MIVKAMSHEAWLARWREGRIGFHEGRPNAFLERHIARLGGRKRVLVPLCGKTEDLAFLAAAGHTVIGVEIAEQAIREFFAEHELTPAISQRGSFVGYSAGPFTLLCGDIFELTPEIIGPVDALYDRAALIALPAESRQAYARHLRSVLPQGALGLVITLEYDQALMEGPPFAVLEAEVCSLYAGSVIERIDEAPARGGGKCSDAGIAAIERCYAVTL
jgi:thiopurine S-methyltransferase